MKITTPFKEQLQQIVERNYDDLDFDYGKLCEELELSRSQVYRYFQDNDLGSPAAYLRQFRLEKAIVLLLETDLPIQEIAFDIGFKSASHFSVSFLEVYGLSPKMYRQQEKNDF